MTFRDLNLSNPLWNALDDAGYTKPTTIQAKAFSVIMSGRDVQGIAQTGTGKTIAYLLPLLKMWTFSKLRHPQILIIVPTRELVVQVVGQGEELTKYTSAVVKGVYGGTNLNTQAAEIAEGLDILVGTPGRLLDLGYHGALNLKIIKKLVIDEVDEMLNLGFRSQLKHIMELLPEKRQNLMFSATITEDVEMLISEYFNSPEKIEAAPSGSPLTNINQVLYRVPNFNTKINLLELLLAKRADMTKILIFVSTKALADELYTNISEKYPDKTGVIHSNKDQNFRFNAVNKFQDGSFRMLIATDIIARGLDIEDVSHVINFDLPDEPQNYVHRIGRTGRADKKGESISLVSDLELDYLDDIQDLMKFIVPITELPDDLVISTELTDAEIPKIQMKNILGKLPKVKDDSSAFQEKKAKNKKVNIKVRHTDKMMAKYGKKKTRGQKKK
ncbi:MAG: DEAD/DEAH box helicase [Saprospiraceae bacterium]|nr:DEAD/DEAH box helicase [Saprospiraceae bacterium]